MNIKCVVYLTIQYSERIFLIFYPLFHYMYLGLNIYSDGVSPYSCVPGWKRKHTRNYTMNNISLNTSTKIVCIHFIIDYICLFSTNISIFILALFNPWCVLIVPQFLVYSVYSRLKHLSNSTTVMICNSDKGTSLGRAYFPAPIPFYINKSSDQHQWHQLASLNSTLQISIVFYTCMYSVNYNKRYNNTPSQAWL